MSAIESTANTPDATPVDLDLTVVHRTSVADNVAEFELRRVDGLALPPWEPGAHIDVVLDDETIRQYSLCGDPDDRDTYRIAVLRQEDGRGGSRRIHDVLDVGANVRLRGPRNHFPLQPANSYLFIAGGIGITPLLPMIRRAELTGSEWTLHYGGRSRRSMAYLDELGRLDPSGTRVTLTPFDEQEQLIDLKGAIAAMPAGTRIYCCGPEPLLAAAELVCDQHAAELSTERFSPKPTGDVSDGTFTVRISSTGQTISVPADQSLLDALRATGISVMASCEEGTCGTCETVVLEGTPDHRDSVLTKKEQARGDRIMVCVSRSCTPCLVLDL